MIFIKIQKRVKVYDPVEQRDYITSVDGLLRVDDIVKIEENPDRRGSIVTIATPSENREIYIEEDLRTFRKHLQAVAGDQIYGDIVSMSEVNETIGSEEENIELPLDGNGAEDFLSKMFTKAGLSWEDADDREELDSLEEEYYPTSQWPKPNCQEGKEARHYKEFVSKAEAWFDNYLENHGYIC